MKSLLKIATRIVKSSLKVLLFTISTYQTAFADQLIFATEIIRHGERTASGDLANFPYEDPRGKNQLTANGIRQVVRLGEQMHKIYTHTYNLIPHQYDPNQIYSRSTDFDRTLMSADAFLMGLFDTGPFAIHTIPLVNDDLLLAYLKYYDIIKTLLADDPKTITLRQELQPKLDRLSNILGTQIEDLDHFFSVVDTLYLRKQFNQPLPPDLSPDEIAELYTTSLKSSALLFQRREIGALISHKLLNTIKNNIDKIISHDKKATIFNLYLTHDVTLAGLMSALGAPLNLYPSYASHISIMLFAKSDNTDTIEHYYIKFLYNNEEIKANECESTKCTLTEFNSLLTNVTLLAAPHEF